LNLFKLFRNLLFIIKSYCESNDGQNLVHSYWWTILSLWFSLWIAFKTIKLGILKNISASLESTYSLKSLNFIFKDSILRQKWIN